MPVMGQPQMLMGGFRSDGMDSGWGWGWDVFLMCHRTNVSGWDGEFFF
jgi:hypothetical protein